MIAPRPQRRTLPEINQQDNEDLEQTQKLPVIRTGRLIQKTLVKESEASQLELTQKLPVRQKGRLIQKPLVKGNEASQLVPSRRPLFREKAMQQYIQRQEKSVLPRFVSPPIFICSWILLGLFLLAILLAWWAEVPTYATGSGVVLAQEQSNTVGNATVAILIFLPATYAPHIHPGLPVQVQIGETGPQYTGTIEHVEPEIMSPDAARKRYMLNPTDSQVITQPSIAVTVLPKTPLLTRQYAGSLISAQVQIGSQRVLSLLPGFNQLIGG